MSIKIKVKIKSLRVEIKNSNYIVLWSPVEKVEACGKTFFTGVVNNGMTDEVHQFAVEMLNNFSINNDKCLFDFLSAHSKENFIITIEENNEESNMEEPESQESTTIKQMEQTEEWVKDDLNYKITEVELIYG